jgi:hypothetical protein
MGKDPHCERGKDAEIEVAQEMLAVGIDELAGMALIDSPESRSEIVRTVYVAMEEVRRGRRQIEPGMLEWLL